ncbi:hypothetical protein QBC41DRAFT_299025 [Cercophora samala]|uniref:Uncharacterized protein n=1 Tax=Cercophora samala TaxID=330535 RepID=A0AA39ZLC4_9PEZI|nr:hypothetical protein QBC41DRAFT_299025 [Cercophora samala]
MTSGTSKILIAVLICSFIVSVLALFCLKLPQKWAQTLAEGRHARAVELAEARAARRDRSTGPKSTITESSECTTSTKTTSKCTTAPSSGTCSTSGHTRSSKGGRAKTADSSSVV